MASVSAHSNVLSISCGIKTIFVRLNDGELFSFFHSEVVGKNCLSKPVDDSTPNKVHSESEEIGLGLVCCDISPSGELLAFCTLSKNLCIVNIKDSNPTLIRTYNLVRGASKVKFTQITNHLVVADKSGDVYLFLPGSDNNQGQLILGHLSLLLDVLVTPDEQFILTCDRDEKIRVSSYPNGYNIVSFCLGHTEFVSSLHLLPHDMKYLISTSGDGTVRFWDYREGLEIEVCETSQFVKSIDHGNSGDNIPAITCAATALINSSTSIISVGIDNFSVCLVLKCSTENGFHCNFVQNISVQNSHLWGISMYSNILWLVLSNSNDIFQVQSEVLNTEHCTFGNNLSNEISNVVQLINNENLSMDSKKNLTDLLYKRKFENVKDYLDRKNLRLFSLEPPNKKVKA